VDGLVVLRLHVVDVVVVRRVDVRVVRAQPRQLVAVVQLDALQLEEHALGGHQQVDVDRLDHRQHQDGEGANQVVDDLVRDDAERRGVLEEVVPAVLGPEQLGGVPQAVLVELEEVGHEPGDEEGADHPRDGVTAQAAVGLRVAELGEPQREQRQHDGSEDALGGLDDLLLDLLGLGLFGVGFIDPL